MIVLDLFFLLGFILLSVGMGMVHIPTAMIIMGVVLMFFSAISANLMDENEDDV